MKRFVLIIALLLGVGSAAMAQDYRNYDDVIYGTDGTIIRGTIVEQVPGVRYTIATRDGNTFVFDALNVEKITKEAPIVTDDRPVDANGKVMFSKSPVWSCLGSLLIPGLGQIINGQTRKGLGIMLGNVGCYGAFMAAAVISSETMDYELAEGATMVAVGAGLCLMGINLYSIIQAPIYAARWNAQNGFALGGDTWLKMEPTVGVSNTWATGTNASYGMKATLTF